MSARHAPRLGRLHGVGVGPGDPELMTLRAVDILGRADMLFAAASRDSDQSTALNIARPYLKPGAKVRRLHFPITADRTVIDRAWDRHARRLAVFLRAGRDCAFLTLGDPLLYSTFGYLLRAVRAVLPEAEVEVTPGVTSFQAAAAKTQTILAEGDQTLAVAPCFAGPEPYRRVADAADSAVILKAYRSFPAIREELRARGLLEKAVLVSRLGQEGEKVERDVAAAGDRPPYFSLLLVKK